MNQASSLFTPLRFAGLDLANRIVVAPMTRISAGPKGVPTARMADYYARYVKGGFGLVITEGTYIDQRYSQGYRDQPGIADDDQTAGWQRVVQAVHGAGGRILLQLIHAGALIQHNDYGDEAIAPSAVQPKGEQLDRYYGAGPFSMPRAMTAEDIEETIRAYGDAAARAQRAGFDGIELHGANGYLPDQFLTDYTNQRDDAFGGTITGRVRFHAKIIEAMRAATGPDFCIGVRLSETKVNDFDYSWPGGTDDAEVIFPAVEKAGASYIHISAHIGIGPVFDSGSTLSGLARHYTDLPVIACGKLEVPERAVDLIEAGEADMVALGKAALADPDWPRKVQAGEPPLSFDPGMIAPVATLATREAFAG